MIRAEIPQWPKISWSAWKDGPFGVVIAGTTIKNGIRHELCVHKGQVTIEFSDFIKGHKRSLRLQAKKVIRDKLTQYLGKLT